MDQTNSPYPGNRDLPAEVKDRVLSTYRQSLAAHEQGRAEEAIAGCELILTMDSSFMPARALVEQARGSDSARAAGGGDALANALLAATRALEARDFQRAIELSNTVLREDLTNSRAQEIGREAQERLEAAPFVDQFLKKARAFLSTGNVKAAHGELDKARSLDPGNPNLRQLEKETPPLPAQSQAFDFSADAPFQFDFDAGSSSPQSGEGGFVLEEPPPVANTRSSQASDFGFSFEEEPPASDQTPEPGPVVLPGEAQTFDFSSASMEMSSDERQRINGLIEDGDAVFEDANYRKATEIWSKIFLLDVTNAAAAERIEKARKLQQELDARVDGILATAIVAFEAGELDNARSGFKQTLLLDPNHPTALEYLKQIPESATAHDSVPPDTRSLDFDPPAPMLEPEEDLYAAYGIPQESDAPTTESTFQPAMPSEPAPATSRAPAKKAKRSGAWVMIAVAALLVAVAGWFAWSYFAGPAESVADDQSTLILSRAQALAKNERYDQAIDLLSSIEDGDPMHDRAQTLIEQYQSKKAGAVADVDGRPAAVVFAELLEQGRTAFMANDYVVAKDALTRAAAIQPLPPEAAAILQNATVQVAKLDSAMVLFKEGKYADAVAMLDGLLEQDPENRSIQQLLANAHFNLGATALREDRIDDAVREFDSVLASNPNDDLARRSREIAMRYREEPKDLLFRIYVKYLPLR